MKRSKIVMLVLLGLTTLLVVSTVLPQEQRQERRTATQTPLGAWTFAGADGEHDDTVIANALAWRAAMTSGPLILFEA